MPASITNVLKSIGYGETLDINAYAPNCPEIRAVGRQLYIENFALIADALEPLDSAEQLPLEDCLDLLAEEFEINIIPADGIPEECKFHDKGGIVCDGGGLFSFLVSSPYYRTAHRNHFQPDYCDVVMTLLGVYLYLRFVEQVSIENLPAELRRRAVDHASVREIRIKGEVLAGQMMLQDSLLHELFTSCCKKAGIHGVLATPKSVRWLTVSQAREVTEAMAEELGIHYRYVWRRLSCSRMFRLLPKPKV